LNPRAVFVQHLQAQATTEHILHSSGDKSVPLLLVHNPRSKRYVLRLKPDGSARVTIPRGGSQRKGRAFAEKNVEWIKRQMQRWQRDRLETQPGLLVQKSCLEGKQ